MAGLLIENPSYPEPNLSLLELLNLAGNPCRKSTQNTGTGTTHIRTGQRPVT